MRALVRALAPTCFDDVSALLALYRPGPDGGEHALRLRRPQERSQAGRIPPPRDGGTARRHLRADDLPRVDDARRADASPATRSPKPTTCARRRARRCGRSWRPSARSSSPAASRPATAPTLGKELFDIIEPFADYAFNKSHTYAYGLIVMADGVAQGAPSRRVLRRAAHLGARRQGRHREVPLGVPHLGIEVQVPDINVSVAGFGATDQIIPVRHGGGPQRRAEPRGDDRGRTRGQRPVRRLLRLLPARRPDRVEQALGRFADQGRRVRRARPSPPGPVPRRRVHRRPRSCSAAANATSG